MIFDNRGFHTNRALRHMLLFCESENSGSAAIAAVTLKSGWRSKKRFGVQRFNIQRLEI
jgi:hypothetical protein